MKTLNQAWRNIPLSIEDWKANCYASDHVRKDDELTFFESRHGTISCWIQGTCVMLGTYFVKADVDSKIIAGCGWNH